MSDALAQLERLARIGSDHHPDVATDEQVTAMVAAVRGEFARLQGVERRARWVERTARAASEQHPCLVFTTSSLLNTFTSIVDGVDRSVSDEASIERGRALVVLMRSMPTYTIAINPCCAQEDT